MTQNGDPEVGDIYDWAERLLAEKEYHYVETYGPGPFLVTSLFDRSVIIKHMPTGHMYHWNHPRNWGRLNVFLTAAHKAIHEPR